MREALEVVFCRQAKIGEYYVFEMIIVDNCLMREAVETVGGGASLASTTDRGTRSPPVGVDPLEAEDLALIVS